MTEEVARPGPAASGFSVKCAIAALQKRDIATGPLLQRAGLSEHALDNPRHRISAIAQMKFLEYAAEAMDDTAFGLHLAEQSDPREAGLLFYVVSAARNLGEAMALFARYNRIVNESARAKIVRQTASVILQVSFVGVPRHRARHISEFEAALIVKVIREITGRHIRPIRIAFAHARTADLREFERFCGCPVEFGAPSDQLEFSKDTVALPLITGDLALLETLRPFCDEATRTRNTAIGSVRASVENEVQRLLPHGQAHAETIAKALAVSVRTLSRRLSAEGTTFVEVVDQLRRSLALEYLKNSHYTTAQISWLLGYESSTSFNHAFKRWTGRSPSAARKTKRLPATASP